MTDPSLKKAAFPALLLSVIVVFFWMRSFSDPVAPVIGGDGLGYYSYLPATFIYGDQGYNFGWFNAAHDSNYAYSAFPNPEDNILVQYGDRRINKYYPGLSVLWMPFFAAAHAVAHISGHEPDGFSAPYQAAIGIASLINLLVGLWLVHRLVLRFTGGWLEAVIVPGALFYGTYLFIYSVNANSLSHAYSFTLIAAVLLAAHRFIHDDGNKTTQVLVFLITAFLLLSVRPLTGLVFLILPAFVPRAWRLPSRHQWRLSAAAAVLSVILLLIVWYVFRIMYIQTGTLLPYTYEGEGFDFSDPWFVEALFGYRLGLFVYAPVLLVAFFGVYKMPRRERFFVPLIFFAAVFLYSAWWYWPILIRALVDFYVLPGICLAYLLRGAGTRNQILLVAVVLLCVLYFQVKSFQVRNGILVEFGTYKEVFWRNFFRLEPARMYLVPPSTIISSAVTSEDFEDHPSRTTADDALSGTRSLLLDSLQYIHTYTEVPYPEIFKKEKGYKKIRFSFHSKIAGDVQSMHVFMFFMKKDSTVIRNIPFYLNAPDLYPGEWDLKEFGTEITPGDSLGPDRVDRIGFCFWNVNARGRILVDDAKIEFLVTDKSYETIEMSSE